LAHIGGDEIIGLVAGLLQARQFESADGFADQRKLGDEVGGSLRPVRLVGRIHLRAERLFRLVKDDSEMSGALFRLHLLKELPQHSTEHSNGTGRTPVRSVVVLRLLIHRLKIGPEDVAGAIDQEDVVAGFEGGGRLRCGHGHDGSYGD